MPVELSLQSPRRKVADSQKYVSVRWLAQKEMKTILTNGSLNKKQQLISKQKIN